MSREPECPCGRQAYARCCGRFIEGGETPQTAQELMRSRYAAYTLRNDAYLLATWHPSTRPAPPVAEGDVKWIGLEVRAHRQEGDGATVEFVARFKEPGGRAHRMHETSRFVREQGKWFYVDGEFKERASK